MQSIVASLEREFLKSSERGYTFLDGDQPPERLTFPSLHLAACSVAADLQAMGAAGQRILIACPHDLGYVKAVCGTLYANAIAVPAFPPNRKRHVGRVRSIISDCTPTIAISSAADIAWIEANASELLELCTWLPIEELEGAPGDGWIRPDPKADDVAILQYTSGSTSEPKGVMVTHGNIDHNCRMLDAYATSDDIVVGWLPFFHDMGLVGGILKMIHSGVETVFMPPARFLQQPFRWLKAISDYRGTVSGSPNFAYDLCVEKIGAEQRASLDLTSWRRSLNGAEPVRARTIDDFRRVFGPCGFRPEALQPCYGMAEATLLISVNQASTSSGAVRRLSPQALREGRAVAALNGSAIDLVQCGSPPPAQCQVVEPNTFARLGANQVGEIWLAGPHVAAGYWNKDEDEAGRAFKAFTADGAGPFFRSGDLGFIDDQGGLFITGRAKDLIIDHGRNIHPTDIEAAAADADPAVKGQISAAFQSATGAIVLCQEVARSALRGIDTGALRGSVIAQVARNQDLLLSEVVLLKPGSIPRTSSGKVQRLKCRDAYDSGDLQALPEQAPRTSPARGSGGSNVVIAALAETLGCPASTIDGASSFSELGLDSVKIVELATRLERTTGRRVSPALCFDHPTPNALAAILSEDAERPAGSNGASQGAAGDAIAIVGMACRFPDASSPQQLWSRLQAGHDAVRSAAPGTRWQDLPDETPAHGAAAPQWRALIDDVDQFDAEFFGITPREAAMIDPQHRLLLELSWEALEDAGIAPASLAGTEAGVFVGISSNDYGGQALGQGGELYAATGNAASIAANRISYALDLVGPSLSIDTACSSSLVALHQACQSLRSGDCRTALAGGVNLLLSRRPSDIFAAAGMLSRRGRCASFSSGADGYVRGEGCGLVVLKPLEDARRDGDRIHAVILGSAVNQDGRSNGLTAPNGRSQEKVIRAALNRAGIEANAVSMVESHGSATPLGDPIEYGALTRVYGERDASHPPCLVTSVKANIGHLEAAAGVAGLIKAVLCLKNGEVPEHPHFEEANVHLDADPNGPVRIAVERAPLLSTSRPRHAGVSSFGFGGTNAHVILREADEVAEERGSNESAHILALSARTPQALQALIHRYEEVEGDLKDICRTAAVGRNHFPTRAAFVAASLSDLKNQLRARRAAGESRARGELAFLFSGQGQNFAQAGAELLSSCDAFRAALVECDAGFTRELGFSVLEKIYGPQDAEHLRETLVMQPCLFALEVALGRFWAARGIAPDYLCGHSLGEYAAAQFGGVLTLDDAIRLVSTRARLMNDLDRIGAMATVFAPVETIEELAAKSDGALSVAAENGPAIVTVSGRSEALETLLADLGRRGVRSVRLPVSHAFHSSLMRPMLPAFAAVAREVRYAPSRIPIATNLSGELSRTALSDADYWVRHIEAPVQFRKGLETLYAAGARTFLEIGPGATLSTLGQRAGFEPCSWLNSLSGRPGDHAWLDATARLYEEGFDIDLRAHFQSSRGRVASLPTYPFERKSHWAGGNREAQPAHAYEIAWRTEAGETSGGGSHSRTLFTGAFGGQLLEELRQHVPEAPYAADPAAVLHSAADRQVDRVIHVLSGDPLRAREEAAELLALVRSLLGEEAHGQAPRLWLVEPAEAASTSFAAGFGLSLAIEKPRIWGGTVLAGPGTSSRDILEAVDRHYPDILLLRDGARLSRQLARIAKPRRTKAEALEGSALLVGGLGGLGLATARWLIENGCRRLVLTGRRVADPQAEAKLAALRASGAEVRYEIADICDAEQMRRVIGSLKDLSLVFHAAGTNSVLDLASLDEDQLWRTVEPKLEGARVLDRLLQDASVRLILYSSISSVWGSRSQAHYAAANACLDRIAETRHAAGLPTISVNWGPWQTGMVQAEHEAELKAIGIGSFAPDEAVRNLSWIVECETPNAVLVDADWEKLRGIFAIHRKGELFDALTGGAQPRSLEPDLAVLAQIRSAPEGMRAAALRSYLAEQIGLVMNLPPDSPVPTDEPLFALGLDSLMAIEVNKRVATDLGCSIDATFVLDHPTIDAMSEHLLDDVLNLKPARTAPAPPPTPLPVPATPEDMDPLIAAELLRLDRLLGNHS